MNEINNIMSNINREIENFTGIKLLLNGEQVVTRENLDALVSEYRKWDEMVNAGTFSEWLEFMIDPSIMKTSEEWLSEVDEKYSLVIMDPDGWDRTDFDYSFYKERITKEEFDRRLSTSTIKCNVNYFTKETE